jgi:GST-like protein
VLDKRLGEVPYLTGDSFSIVDVMNYTWPRAVRTRFGWSVDKWPNLKRWLDAIEARPAIARALALAPPA